MKLNGKKQSQNGMLVTADGRTMEYCMIKSSRRTLALQVTREGLIVVRIPNRVTFEEGSRFARSHLNWIDSHRETALRAVEEKKAQSWEDGTQLMLYGEGRILRLELDEESSRMRVCDTGPQILVSGPIGGDRRQERIKEVLINWYKKQCRQYLADKTAWWAARMGVTFYRISIRDQATRWGSCSAKGNINYNWKLILVPEELADYVVVHELAHRVHMDHSPEFWEAVEQEIPDYRLKRRRLQDYEKIIDQKY